MLAMLADNANVIYFALAALALILLYVGWTTRRTKFWAWAGGAVGLIALVWLLTKFVVTDRQQILLNLEAMAVGAEKQDADAIFKHVSKDFRFGASDREDLYKRIAASVKAHRVKQIALWDKNATIKGDSAEVTFRFRAARELGEFQAAAKAEFVREAGAWKMRNLQILNPVTREPQPLPGF